MPGLFRAATGVLLYEADVARDQAQAVLNRALSRTTSNANEARALAAVLAGAILDKAEEYVKASSPERRRGRMWRRRY